MVVAEEDLGKESSLYWNKDNNNLMHLIDQVDQMNTNEIEEYGKKAKSRIEEAYSWEFIIKEQLYVILETMGENLPQHASANKLSLNF